MYSSYQCVKRLFSKTPNSAGMVLSSFPQLSANMNLLMQQGMLLYSTRSLRISLHLQQILSDYYYRKVACNKVSNKRKYEDQDDEDTHELF